MSRIQDQRARAWTSRRKHVEGKPPRVLVVDDSHNAAETLVAFLGLENLETRPAFGGLEAVEIARRWLPDLIVMDISMPRCNGFEASRALRADAVTNGIVIVAFTALDEHDVRRHLADDEFDGYCQKGQPPATLLALIWTFLLKK
jgi:two-component system, OmpR family, response regulator